MTAAAQPRVLPVVILALGALFALKAANLWVGLAGADAAEKLENPSPDLSLPFAENGSSDAERRILEQLAGRRAELERREQAITTRESVLAAAELRIEARLAELKQKETELAGVLAEEKRNELVRFESLSSAYSRMKPRDAARIFNELEDDLLLPVAAGMRPQALSQILAGMEPEKAMRLTRLIADRGDSAPDTP